MDTLININRGMTKLCMPVYLVLSVRRSMETHIQTQADGKQTYTRMYRVCIPRSKCHTSNGDACKLKQTKNKTSCACLPRSKRQVSNRDAYSNARKQAKTKPTRACIPRSKRQTSSQTSNVDACKLKQTKNKATHACIPRSKR